MICKYEKIQWIQLVRSNGLGKVTLHLLKKLYKKPSNIIDYLQNLPDKIKEKKVKILYSYNKAKIELEKTEELGGQIIFYEEPHFSKRLKEIPYSPLIITTQGDASLLDKEIVAIAGSRSASINSMSFINNFALELSKNSIVVASGLAEGIDISANKVILDNFPTIGVLAGGIDTFYPAKHAEIQKKIAYNGGLIITERAIASAIKPFTFILRNKLMVSISSCVLIAESRKNSGSLNTAAHAISLKKPLFALPNFPQSKNASGSNYLLKQGANFTEYPQDIIDVLCKKKESNKSLFLDSENLEFDYLKIQTISINEMIELKDCILNKLDYTKIPIDDLLSQLQCNINTLLNALVELELSNQINIHDDDTVNIKIQRISTSE